MADIGIVYILKHSTGNLVKVGETRVSSAKRLAAYMKEHSLVNFEHHADFKVPLDARRDIEKKAHAILKSQGFETSFGDAREIFACTPEIAAAAIVRAKDESIIYLREKERHERERIKKDKLAKETAEYDKAYRLFEQKLEIAWTRSHLAKKFQRDLDELHEPLKDNSFFLFLLFLVAVVPMTIGLLGDIFKNGFSSEHLIVYASLGGLIWFYVKYKENHKKYEAWSNRKNTIKAELNDAKKQFLEPQVREYKRLHPVPTEQKNNF
jgi:hypothetical protein